MSDRITANDLGNIAGIITRQMVTLGLLNEGERVVIESGSAAYGRAWKVFVTGGQYETALHEPSFGSFYSQSARELWWKLQGVSGALGAVKYERGQAYARERIAEGVQA